ncbi:chemokine-like protein TAFA-1 [Entelurus aequoreus]|uniref:chemokine-like protein TAFA-1 n=1 Tax=Entelurus aequoreus TaxID=161455 RepID=UPI002B1E60E7|nr:chemokine-like protein TAFA-1 [Entelurus aequoreus]
MVLVLMVLVLMVLVLMVPVLMERETQISVQHLETSGLSLRLDYRTTSLPTCCPSGCGGRLQPQGCACSSSLSSTNTFSTKCCSSSPVTAVEDPVQEDHIRLRVTREHGHLSSGSCEVVMMDRDSSQPRRTIARQTARCACRKGQIAGTVRARPACVDVDIVSSRQWCLMGPCLDHEGCHLLLNQAGWTCTQPGGRVKTTTVS